MPCSDRSTLKLDVEMFVLACFADHLYGIRPVQTTIIVNMLYGCGQKSHPK